MEKLRQNRFFKALWRAMLFAAVLHTVILVLYVIHSRDLSVLNYFSIVGLDLFFPDFVRSVSLPISALVTLAIYLFIYFFFTHENRPHSR